MIHVKRFLFYILDIVIIISLASILFILITGGFRIGSLEIGLVSCERPLIFLAVSLLLKKLFYRRGGLLNRILSSIERCPPRNLKIYIFLISLLLFTFGPFKIVSIWESTGDEPHYLMIASSLAKDLDLNLRNNYDNMDYLEFYPRELAPHARVYTEDKIYSAHGLGLPILILPGYILGNRYGASYTMGILFALLSVVLFALCYRITNSKIISIGLTFLISFTVPLVFYSYQIFTELPAALIVSYLFLFTITAKERPATMGKFIFIGFLLAYLPWLHIRYLIFAGLIFVYLCYKMGLRKTFPVFIMIALSIILFLFYMKSLYGILSLTAQYLGVQIGWSHLPKGLMGNFFDFRFGLFLYSPYYIFLGAGMYFLYKINKNQFLWWSLIVIPFIIGVSSFYHWHGGCCPPLRYITPVVPLFIMPLGYLLISCRNWLFHLLFFMFAWAGLAMAKLMTECPWLLYNDEYSSSKILDHLGGIGINIKWLFPSLYETSRKDCVSVAIWLISFTLVNYIVVGIKRHNE